MKKNLAAVPDQSPSNDLPEGITKEDLVKADPPAVRYLSPEDQALLGLSVRGIELSQAQSDSAVARLQLAQSQQQIIVRDILVEMGVTHKTHQISRDQAGRFFLEEVKV